MSFQKSISNENPFNEKQNLLENLTDLLHQIEAGVTDPDISYEYYRELVNTQKKADDAYWKLYNLYGKGDKKLIPLRARLDSANSILGQIYFSEAMLTKEAEYNHKQEATDINKQVKPEKELQNDEIREYNSIRQAMHKAGIDLNRFLELQGLLQARYGYDLPDELENFNPEK